MKLLPGFATFDDVFENMFSDPFFQRNKYSYANRCKRSRR